MKQEGFQKAELKQQDINKVLSLHKLKNNTFLCKLNIILIIRKTTYIMKVIIALFLISLVLAEPNLVGQESQAKIHTFLGKENCSDCEVKGGSYCEIRTNTFVCCRSDDHCQKGVGCLQAFTGIIC
ncbi:unnamed protein product [Paramecium sonneborni]|uniref:Uncharacterized protein n=1 Tax=Paramecium sonneborni TaxID=65129 RepID=A0A8S1NIG3_9CILI|nr:unnamed protein product [Paramecium sonneborni]